MSQHPSRRRFLGLLGSAALAAGCGTNSPARNRPFEGRTLTVFVYSGLDEMFREGFAGPFEAATGAAVEIDAGWWDAIGKLKASPKGRPAYDLVLTDATQGYPAIKDGLFRQIDFKKLTNLAGLHPGVLDNQAAKDRYGVTFPESAQVIAFDKRRAGDSPPAGWGDLMRPAYSGRLALYNHFYMSLFALAAVKVAADGRPGTAHAAVENDLAGVLDFARRERKRVGLWWPSGPKMLQDLLAGNFAAGNAHSVTLLQAVAEKPDVVGVAAPEADRAFVQLMWVIPADTPNADVAEAAIDALIGKDMQLAMARRGAGIAHVEAAAVVAAENPLWAATYPHTPARFDALRYFPYEAYFKDWAGLNKVWDEEILRAS